MSEHSDQEKTLTPEEPETITKKDPRKVEQGKRLAMISKEAKERKMRARLEKEREDNKSWYRHAPIFVAVGSSLGLVIALYFLSRKPKVVEKRVEIPTEKPVEKKKFVSNKNFEEL